jgi:hypothetical protein
MGENRAGVRTFRGFRGGQRDGARVHVASLRFAAHPVSSAAALVVVLHATPVAAEDDLEDLTDEERRELGLPPSPPPSFRRLGKGLFWAPRRAARLGTLSLPSLSSSFAGSLAVTGPSEVPVVVC